MKTLFGIRSNIAATAVGAIYLLISLNTCIKGINTYKEFRSEDHVPHGSLLIDTETTFFHIFTLALSVSCLLSSMLLILGVIEKRHSILKPWLIVNFVLEAILTSFVLYLLYVLIQVFHSTWMNICGLLLAIFVNAIAVVFHDYIWNGVYCLYQTFRRDSRRLYRLLDNEDNEAVQIV